MKTKSRKILKPVLITAACLALAALAAFLGARYFYYPHYLSSKSVIELEEAEDGAFGVMSFNIRCKTSADVGKKGWYYRADLVIKTVQSNQPAIIGFQEATKAQYVYLCQSLEGYDSIMTLRDSTAIAEACPVFYRTDMFELVDKGSFWLSETPDEMSISWNSACYRICSYVILKHRESGRELAVFNTHLDHVSEQARINGIGVVLDKLEQFGNMSALLMGDFNADEGSPTYESAAESFTDVKYAAADTMSSHTYHAHGLITDGSPIDFIFMSKTGLKAEKYEVITTDYDGVYPSDHFPVAVRVELDG